LFSTSEKRSNKLICRSTRRLERGCKLWEDRLSRLVRSDDRQDLDGFGRWERRGSRKCVGNHSMY
jgi:hypothetical protein